ncbi:OSK1 [Symbiodinium natans]|uniref:OSK1 protein n=1 Tax=Symbiodinium natans TaxID=878477 RepID=A0A812GS88_9DINO|nr:OSK1 [Symbiodinium natans]
MSVPQRPEEAQVMPGCRGAQCIQGFVQRIRRRPADRCAATATPESSEPGLDALLAGAVEKIRNLVEQGEAWQETRDKGLFDPTDFDEEQATCFLKPSVTARVVLKRRGETLRNLTAPFMPGCRGAQCIKGVVQRMRRRRADRRAARAAPNSSEPGRDALVAGAVENVCNRVDQDESWQEPLGLVRTAGGGLFAPTDFDEDVWGTCCRKFSMNRLLKRFRRKPQALKDEVSQLLTQVLALTDYREEICDSAMENVDALLERNRRLHMTQRNWRPILVAALLVASRPRKDVGAWKVAFENRLQAVLGLRSSAFEQLEEMMLLGLGHDPQAAGLRDYTLGATVGAGSFAKVKLATRISTEETVALKILRNRSWHDAKKVHDEAQILKRFWHPNIVKMHEVVSTRCRSFIIMEYVGGGDLFEYVHKQPGLEEPEARRLFRQIMAGLEEVHAAKVAHGDLKLENLLLDEEGNVKIADFGLSTALAPGETHITSTCGTVHYAAPEVLQGGGYVPYPADLWSCGVILYIMICGCEPFKGLDDHHLRRQILSASYKIPLFTSPAGIGLIAGLLRVTPWSRFSIAQVRAHAWYRRVEEALPKDAAETLQAKTAYAGCSSLMRNSWRAAGSGVNV